jgi:hypothetical protein
LASILEAATSETAHFDLSIPAVYLHTPALRVPIGPIHILTQTCNRLIWALHLQIHFFI